MNFLEIAQRLHRECGLSGPWPLSLAGQSGQARKVVEWAAAAYNDIQSAHLTWNFLRKEFTFSCTPGVDVYGASNHLIDDVAEWDRDTLRCSIAASDEQQIDFYYWEDFRDTWKIGAAKTRVGRPVAFSVKPNLSLVFDCLPDQAYTISGEYYAAPVPIGAETDSPIFPEQYHLAVVWRGLMLFAADSGEGDRYIHGDNEYNRLMAKMEITQLPMMEEGPPLA